MLFRSSKPPARIKTGIPAAKTATSRGAATTAREKIKIKARIRARAETKAEARTKVRAEIKIRARTAAKVRAVRTGIKEQAEVRTPRDRVSLTRAKAAVPLVLPRNAGIGMCLR